jgi:predicted enzyme related to lactoylglutathione lyase
MSIQGGGFMDKVVHFEIPYDDKGRASKFYSEIFGWKLLNIPEMDYTLIHAAQVDNNNLVCIVMKYNGK